MAPSAIFFFKNGMIFKLYDKYLIRLFMPELVENDTLFALLLSDNLSFSLLTMVLAAILNSDIRVILNSTPDDRCVIEFVMPILVANDTLLIFLAQLPPEILDFLYCQMVLAAIFKMGLY